MRHGHLVGPGIVLLAALQGQGAGPPARALKGCAVPLDDAPPATIRRTLLELPAYSSRHGLPYGLAPRDLGRLPALA